MMESKSSTTLPILATGAHRSGTTWVGKMLAADADTAYISEPLNVLHRPGIFRAQVKYWYQYICEENEGEYLSAFQHLLADNTDLSACIQRIMGKDYFVMDQWQLEELAKVVAKCKVKVVTDGLPPETLRKCYVEPAESVESAVAGGESA